MKWIGCLLLVLLLAGCGSEDSGPSAGDGATPSTPATSTPATSAPTTPSASPSTSAPASPSPIATPKPTYMPTIPAEVPPSDDAVDLTGEEWPQFVNSGLDITCLFEEFDGVQVRCDVLGAKWQVQRPGGCQEAYGDSVTLRDKAQLTCHGDTIFSPDVTVRLGAGRTVEYRDFTCRIGAHDVTCDNGAGAAFTVSKAGYSIS